MVNCEWPPSVHPMVYDSRRCLCVLHTFVLNTVLHTDRDDNSSAAEIIMFAFNQKWFTFVQSNFNLTKWSKQINKNNDLLGNPLDHPFCLMYNRWYSRVVCTCAGHTALAVAVDEIPEIGDANFPLLEIHDSISDRLSNNVLCLVFPHHYFVPVRWKKKWFIHQCTCKIMRWCKFVDIITENAENYNFDRTI